MLSDEPLMPPPPIRTPVAGQRIEVVLRQLVADMNALANWMHQTAKRIEAQNDDAE